MGNNLRDGWHRVKALHPDTSEIMDAYLIEDHFGKGKDAINFGWFNSPNWSADSIVWEFNQ